MSRRSLGVALLLSATLAPGCPSPAPRPSGAPAPGMPTTTESPIADNLVSPPARLVELRPGEIDGRLAYATTRHGPHTVEVRDLRTGDATPLERGSEPAWSPDGGKVAFVAYDLETGDEIFVMNADGTGLRQLTSSPDQDRDPNWSPDGSRILFWSKRDGNSELYMMKADGSGQRRLTHNDGNDQGPAWSPDGTMIAFHSQRGGSEDIYVMRADGSSLRRLTDGRTSSVDPAWSPDSGWIAFAQHRNGTWCLCVIRTDGTGFRRLTDTGSSVRTPAWSPDGRWIAYAASYEGESKSEDIYAMDPEGTRRANVTSAADGFEWSPSWTRRSEAE